MIIVGIGIVMWFHGWERPRRRLADSPLPSLEARVLPLIRHLPASCTKLSPTEMAHYRGTAVERQHAQALLRRFIERNLGTCLKQNTPLYYWQPARVGELKL